MATSRYLHVANGTSTTDTILEAGIPGLTSIWADALHDGPVPGGLSDEELLAVRARYMASSPDEVEDVAAELESWRRVLERTDAYDELVLWYEHDLFDQLNLLQLLTRIRATVADRRRVTLICIGSFPERPRFKGLGELTPAELASLFETRQPVTAAQYGLAARAWDAFRSDDPRQIDVLVHADTSALPYLLAALQRYLEEFPWMGDGLSRTERRVMSLASRAPADVWAIWPHVHDLETAFYIADQSYWTVVQGLASAAPPLLELREMSAAANSLPRATIALTTAGVDVLEGRADRVQLSGIDRWLGGVHLAGSGPVWRWDEAQARIVFA